MVAKGLRACRDLRYKRMLRKKRFSCIIEPGEAVVFAYRLLRIRTQGIKVEKVVYERLTLKPFCRLRMVLKTIRRRNSQYNTGIQMWHAGGYARETDQIV